MNNLPITNKLNDLLQKNYDSEQGFKKAAENIESSNLKSYFNGRAEKRYAFGHELKAEIKSLGGTPEKGTSVTGDLHRAWIDFRGVFNMNNDEAIMEECERGEQNCLKEYDDFLQLSSLPQSTRDVVQKQRNIIANTFRNVRQLEESLG